MSYDRACHMSDLNQVESRMRREIAEAESAASRAASRIASIQDEMDATDSRVNQLVSDFGDLSGSFADHRNQLYGLEGEVASLELKQRADERRIKQNESFIENLQSDVSLLEQDLEGNRQAIEQVHQHAQVLQREVDLAHNRIEHNTRHIDQLQAGVQQINSYLAAERARQEQERTGKMSDLEAQAKLAAELRAQIEPARARFSGLYNEFISAVTMVDQAEQNRVKNNLETAISQYQNAQNILLKIARDADERERAFENKSALCRATLEQLKSELELVGNKDMKTWYPLEFDQVRKRFDALQTAFTSKQYENAGDPVEVRLALEQMSNQGMQINQDLRLLEAKLAETIAQHQERKARAKGFVGDVSYGDNHGARFVIV